MVVSDKQWEEWILRVARSKGDASREKGCSDGILETMILGENMGNLGEALRARMMI